MDLSKYEGLKKWEESCEELAVDFLEELYGKEYEEYWDDAFWVGGEVGGVLSWGDWFVDMNNIADYFRYNYTPDQFFDWYDQWIAEGPQNAGVNMKNFLKLKS